MAVPLELDCTLSYGSGDITDKSSFEELQIAVCDCPEKRLCAAIVKDAIKIVVNTPVRSRTHNQVYREAATWFKRGGNLAPFSFYYICEVLGISRDRFLRRLDKFL